MHSWIALLVAALTTGQYISTIDPLPVKYAVDVDFFANTSDLSDLTAPKLQAINDTVFEWWYFDAVSSSNPNASVVLTFFTTTTIAFPFVPPNPSSVLLTYVWATLPNGITVVDKVVPSDAAVMGEQDRSSGIWENTGGWMGRATGYEAWIGWEGSRLTPPLSPCSTPNGFNLSLELGAYLGWVGLVPDAHAVVDLLVDGHPVQFTGYGYHDKNWGSRPFQSMVATWSWGHAHVGPYSIVWMQYTQPGVNSTVPIASAYVARDGQVVQSGCAADIVSIQQRHTKTSYGVEVVMSGVHLQVQGTVQVAGDGKHYFRWNGGVSGEILGERVEGGVAVFEAFELE
ncbi:hypothetical protein BO94DRAFT_545299 [Aspergillus sclerotioniger CBS 115572]|uniref:Hydroxyneurosporene synthase n=1 Tax=Aspergillus sclerotioniger CBS 115572 TaxID=1450535 RepID=A0A317WZ12_9EURO|nr:hypothetical protein BO94DRAFT_545299 [Aspergillus sclerotioniger CBS 115572]PWY90572.1 hypothetical protein BO94DRAFT_545299 [Aspergillus sclerotioniger CBS 115572]